jgi:hypothetical protein
MEEMFLQFKLTELKHVILTLRQCNEGPWMREYIRHFNTLVDFLYANKQYSSARELVVKHGDKWTRQLFNCVLNAEDIYASEL